ncbi:MAG: potassium-transporting ATPase subunit KdpA, partial [Chitinophagaceae bacterium]
MNTEILGIVAMFLITLVLAVPLGKYIAKVYGGEKTWLDPILNPLDRLFFKTGGIKPETEMTWKQHLLALLTINLFWFILAWLILTNQGWLPFNPDGNPSMSPDLAFNTVISFLVNCNLQHYSGETGVSYLSQIAVLMFLQFVSAATGMAAAAVVFNALKNRTTDKLGNFYNYFIKSCTRILLPLSIVIALILVFNGSPMTMEGKDQFTSMQGDTVNVSRGPVATFVAIKHLGTNGGG